MHIAYQEHHSGEPKRGFSEKLWQGIRFAVVTGMIFAISFGAMNYSAYRQIFASWLNPEAQMQAEQILVKASGQNVDLAETAANLLPVLPTKKVTAKKFDLPETVPFYPPDYRLVIPKLGKSVPLVNVDPSALEGQNWEELERSIQSGLEKGVVHYPGTAEPGAIGNLFLTGHSSFYAWNPSQYKDVFALLGQLEIGDRYFVYKDGRQYTYEVYDKFEVTPDQVHVLEQPNNRKISTLMTCTPVGTRLRRLIIQANDITVY